MWNHFSNDHSLISNAFLLRLITGQGLKVHRLLRIIHLGTGTRHTLTLLESGRYVCDCCMGSNLGIPCRHFYCALLNMKELVFHIALIRHRWWQDPNIDPATIAPVSLKHTVHEEQLDLRSHLLPMSQFSNPLERNPGGHTPPPVTQSINARAVYQEAHAALKPLLNGVQTQEQLGKLLGMLKAIK
ncbi:hypothetical protein K439DRAFT_1362967 [Ramaria rubella]|nr:hypothetical protein K439DRAFT_1362967 [Ramaria rubella]